MTTRPVGTFLDPLRLQLLPQGERRRLRCIKSRRRFRLLARFRYVTSTGEIVVAKQGSLIDGASIPCFFWRVIGQPMGEYAEAAVIHDVLWGKIVPHLSASPIAAADLRWANWIFLDAMRTLGVARWRRWAMWMAVALAAWWRTKQSKKGW